MTVEELERIGPALTAFMKEFEDCFGRKEVRAHARTYVRGQLSDLPRKSVEPMADWAGIEPRALQRFLAARKWDELLMEERVHRMVARDHAHAHAIGIVDETSFEKKGTKTPGVQRQHCGATGKQDNCTVTVHLSYTASDFHCLLASALFLPESWAADRKRCEEAGIPADVTYRPKWKIALELHAQARAYGVHTEWLTADEYYGRPVEFHQTLSSRQQKYVLEVPSNFWAWCRRPRIFKGKRGAYRSANPAISTVADLAQYAAPFAAQAWTRYRIKDGKKGPIVWEAKAAPVYLKDDTDLPTGPHWLIVARNVLNLDEVKYFISNAPLDTPLETLLAVAFSRWHVERCFEDPKTELGLDHFEVRTYRALMRHLILTAISFLFVARYHQTLKRGLLN